MKVGYYAPLPPARTGVADYAASLLEALGRLGRVDVAARDADVALYHLGNNQLHREIYERALERPGVAVLHDAVLQHFFLGSLEEAAYIEEFVYNYGEWNRGLAARMWRERAGSGVGRRYFEYPMLRRVAEISRAVVVHNAEAARMVKAHHAAARVAVIPHLFVRPTLPDPVETARFRERCGVRVSAPLFGIFGFLRESKRIGTALRAFARLRASRPDAALLVAGEFVSSDLERSVGPLMAAPGVVRLPYLEERAFWLAASAVDACINLRDPGTGETSGIAVRMMGIGKPVFLSDAPENADFPETACLRVPRGAAEEDALWENMVLLCELPDARRQVGRRAAAHVDARHSIGVAAGLYWNLLCDFASSV